MREAVKAEGITLSYGGMPVLKGVSFAVNRGDYIGLIGPNGSGKTTLLKTLLGLAPTDSGSASLFGVPVKNFRDWERIGYLPQRSAPINPLFPATVAEVVEMGLAKGAKAHRVKEALEAVGMAEFSRRLIGNLSGGQQQRALLARTIVNKPDLLLLDEPSSALDHDTRETFFNLLARMNKERGVAIILVTHDMGEVGHYAARLLFLDREIIFYGSLDEVCRSQKLAEYLGPHAQHIVCHRHDREHPEWKH